MRPGQKNNRSRGRGNGGGGRKNVNPLSRSYESNGPDVKVRGNPATIAEKYVQLARDAQASGDSVMAENYFQHAEHYFRIISAAQAQSQARQEERERAQAERQEQNPGENQQADADSAKADDASDAAEAESPEAMAEKAEAKSGEEETPRPRRAPRARRPRRKPTENAELAEAPQPSMNLGDAELPKVEAKNDDEPAGSKDDDNSAKEAAE
ncbi:DUF4167 domain-containing protein [Maritalea porphyrae]|uniref:DUF4167 domain-containing protein n=1 Tax=Maritalea porphyrae TaxID=880732 RepID=A0ABQ5UQ44_9HYPH|nr:DUF4167 domain-containing protein [Maritalea porphyrae]GLQ16476.1 hypothetical protein GCM10007879_07250 [Maritalea porphyrae]